MGLTEGEFVTRKSVKQNLRKLMSVPATTIG